MLLDRRHAIRTSAQQAAFFRARERRRDLAGWSSRFPTQILHGSTGIGVTPLDTDALFPDRLRPIMFSTRIRVLANGGIHRGLIFELGSSARGAAAWVGDQTIGLTAGSGSIAADRATAIWNFGAELPPGREFLLTFAIVPGAGRVRIFDGGLRIADTIASNGNFNGAFADAEDGSFASALVTSIAPDVPAVSQIAPSGFEVIEPLTVFYGSQPSQII